mgnify:CR=1 FL=1
MESHNGIYYPKETKDIESNPKEKNGGTKTFLFYYIFLNSKATLNI